MSFHIFEILSLWGMVFVGAISTLYTVLISKDDYLRRSAIFNLTSYLITSAAVFFFIKDFLPTYSYFKSLQSSWRPLAGWNIVVYIFFTDYLFYLYHRLTHSIPLLWTGHFSHHSGDRLHLSLILRDNILANIFTLPIGLLGIPLGFNPYGIYICVRFILFYQSFLHFYVKKDIPYLKYIFVTPYNHIIHHSTKFEGLGQNFGGILCWWDRLAGTYREGTSYLQSFGIPGLMNPNSLWKINVIPAKDLIKECYAMKSLWPLFKVTSFPDQYRFHLRTALIYSFGAFLLILLILKAVISFN